jgi:23S rRNA A1618 N6-methylase RlmF
LGFEDLSKAMEEFGIVMRRPPFLEDKAKVKK